MQNVFSHANDMAIVVSSDLKYKNSKGRMFASLLMQYIITDNQSYQITYYDEIKQNAQDSQVVSTKENLNLSHGGPSQRQTSGLLQFGPCFVIQCGIWCRF